MNFLKYITLCIFLLLPTSALSCACCADRGEWFQEKNKFEDWQVEELNKLNFGNRAHLFLAEHAPEIKGISTNLRDIYLFKMNLVQNNSDWNFNLKTFKGDSGVLKIKIPEKRELFRVDIKDNPDKGYGPQLYKETRFEGKIKGTGIFKTGKYSDARYRLILQARGGLCDSNEEYKSWILVVTGTKSAFTLHGEFEHPKKTKQ